jgi:signal transduction histidine kinase
MKRTPEGHRAAVLPGDSEMARRIRDFDWSGTGLGPVDRWPQSLRTSVATCLECAFPFVLWWGPDLITIYNDEYRSVLGAKHPSALGDRARNVWWEIWDVIGPMLARVMQQGESTRSHDLLLIIERHGYTEECYFSFSYSPIYDENGGVGGVFCPVIETTDRVIGERRLRTLRDLGSACQGAATEESACRSAAEALAGNRHDVPFAMIYLIDAERSIARLAAVAGIAPDAAAAPAVVALGPDGDGTWTLGTVARSGKNAALTDLPDRFGVLPTGAWPDPPHTALLLPVSLPGQEPPRAIIVAAVSPWRVLDADYRTFFELVATQLAAGLADARATERTEELEKTAERLRLSERMASLGTLTAGLGHDMGNLLLPLDVRLELLLRADLPLELHEHVVGIQKCARYLQRLSKGLRLLATDPAGARMEASTELRTWWNDAGMILKDVLPRSVEFEHRLPDYECWIAMGRTALTQAVFNLVQNAGDALRERGTGCVHVSAESEPEGAWVTLSVTDDGPGMTAEVLRRCIEPYFSTKSRAVATGMGLPFVHGLVTAAGGRIQVDSTRGGGTTIRLTLPRTEPREALERTRPEAAEVADAR